MVAKIESLELGDFLYQFLYIDNKDRKPISHLKFRKKNSEQSRGWLYNINATAKTISDFQAENT